MINWDAAFQKRTFEAEVPMVGRVTFRVPTAGDRLSAEQRKYGKDGTYDAVQAATIPACLVASSVMNGEGLKWGPADIPQIMQMDAQVFDCLLDAINRNCTSEGLESAKKNLEPACLDSES